VVTLVEFGWIVLYTDHLFKGGGSKMTLKQWCDEVLEIPADDSVEYWEMVLNDLIENPEWHGESEESYEL
jgi:hypothetical protein